LLTDNNRKKIILYQYIINCQKNNFLLVLEKYWAMKYFLHFLKKILVIIQSSQSIEKDIISFIFQCRWNEIHRRYMSVSLFIGKNENKKECGINCKICN
jgi:hypothetical protein